MLPEDATARKQVFCLEAAMFKELVSPTNCEASSSHTAMSREDSEAPCLDNVKKQAAASCFQQIQRREVDWNSDHYSHSGPQTLFS